MDNKKKIFKITFSLSLSCLILIALWKFFKWYIIETLSSFLYILILPIFSVIILIILITCLIIMRKQKVRSSIIMIILCIVTAAAPIEYLSQTIHFKTQSQQYNQVAQYVLSPSDDNYIIQTINASNSDYYTVILNNGFKHLSGDNGKIYVFKNKNSGAVFFNAHQKETDNMSGFVYLINNESDSLLSNFGIWKHKKKIQNHWYFYSAV